MLEAAMQRSVVIIPAKTKESLQTAAKLKVAAYCPVSTDQEEQESSYEAQISYYTEKISKNPDWSMVKIFADDGITGTRDKKRDQFIERYVYAESGRLTLYSQNPYPDSHEIRWIR